MGYTHYFRHPKGVHTDFASRMPAIAQDARVIMDLARHHVAGPEGYPESAPVVTDETITFNGIGHDSHEAFNYPPVPWLAEPPYNSADLFDFCKTGRKPYDAAVVAVMLAIKHHMGDDVTLHTDALPDYDDDEELMAKGLALYRNAFPDRLLNDWLPVFTKEARPRQYDTSSRSSTA